MNPTTDTAEIDLQPLRESVNHETDIAVEPPREIIVRTLDQFVVDPETNGNSLLGKRWLCRGGALLLAAPTGIGKTSFSLQAAITWALERPHFGIAPSGRLKVLIVQGENDDADLAEIVMGFFAG